MGFLAHQLWHDNVVVVGTGVVVVVVGAGVVVVTVVVATVKADGCKNIISVLMVATTKICALVGARKESVHWWVQEKHRCSDGCKESNNVMVGARKTPV